MIIVYSYTIYGRNIREYYQPVLDNINFLRGISGTNFKTVIFSEESLVKDIFKDKADVIVPSENGMNLIPPKLWRYYVSKFCVGDVYLCRDSDSIITKREMLIVDDWLQSSSCFQIIRDSSFHLYPIMAGTFGWKVFESEFLLSLLDQAQMNYGHFYDQLFLSKVVYPRIIERTLVHTSFLGFKNEKVILLNKNIDEFVGSYAYRKANISLSSLDKFYFLSVNRRHFKLLKYSTRLCRLYLRILLKLNAKNLYLSFINQKRGIHSF